MKTRDYGTFDQRGHWHVRGLLYALILLSGAAGLVYEVVWARQLTLFMGNTAVANAAVLSAFMLGLALGSLLLGRIADAAANPLRLYAMLEILIGCYGASTPWLFALLQSGYAWVAGVVGVSGAYSHLPRFLIAVAAMLIPTFLMGGTLPLLVKYFAQRLSQAQPVTSRIYGINTLGATAGAFAAGFLLLPAFGITQTLLLAAAVNVLVGLGVYALLQRKRTADKAGSARQKELPVAHSGMQMPQPWLLLAGFMLSGFAALLYQVVWIHALILVIGVSIYAFSTVLTVYLAGIAAGSLLIGKLFTNRDAQRSLKLAFYLQLGIALSAIASLGMISQMPVLFVQGWARLHESFPLFQAYMFLLAGLVIIVPTVLLGALFPLVTGLWSQRKGVVGQGVGEAYGANALGTIAGSAIGGLFILGWLGIEHSLYLASAVSTAVAVIFWYLGGPHRSFSSRWVPGPLAIGLLLLTISVLPGLDRAMLQAETFRNADRYTGENVAAKIRQYLQTFHFLYYKEGIHGTVSVISWVTDGMQRKALMNNGKVDASTNADMQTQILLGQVPMFLHGSAREVMVIGLGSGVTAGSVLRSSTVRNLDLLEISPEVVEAAYYFRKENHDVLNDPRTRLLVADARNYLLATDQRYDVIVSEPSHSWVTGVANLFTRDFLQLAREHLKEDGMLVQWFHIYGVDRNSLKAMLKAVADVFPHFSIWYAQGGDLIIVSSNKPLELDFEKQQLFFSSPEVSNDLQQIGVTSVEKMMTHYMMASSQIEGLLAGQQSNTDDHPIVEFTAPKYIYDFTTDDNVRMLFGELAQGEFALPVVNLVQKNPGWIAVPFMGIGLRTGNDGYTAPHWNVVRTSVFSDTIDNYRLMGGMNGEIALQKPWGEVVVHATMADRGAPTKDVLLPMMENDVPKAEQTQAGELKAPGVVVYWRVGPSAQLGKLKVALARQCERPSGFDSFVAFATDYPGSPDQEADVRQAIQSVNQLVQCLAH